MGGENLLIQWRRWVVGNGNNIHILNDKRIPGVKDLSNELWAILQQNHCQQLDCPVSSLIDPNSGWWNLAKFRVLFIPKIVEAILKVHLSHLEEHDFWMWEYEKTGTCSISSAYRFFKTYLTPDHGNFSSATEKKKFWDTMWRLKIPQKVKIFVQRACQESLPSKQNLMQRNIPINSQCCFCDYQVEDLCHALLQCPSIHQFQINRSQHYRIRLI